MGRGLSDLQKTILWLALRNREAEGRTEETSAGADVFYAEHLST